MIVLVNTTALYPTLKEVRIENKEYILNTSASFNVEFFNTVDKRIDIQDLTVSGSSFNSWGANDQYIVDLVLAKFGLTIKV